MNQLKMLLTRNSQTLSLILKGIIILIIIGLNFYLLNKVISGSETPKIIEKNLRI
jgi:hypothetical protein